MTRPEKPARFSDLRDGSRMPTDCQWVTTFFIAFIIASVIGGLLSYLTAAQCLSC